MTYFHSLVVAVSKSSYDEIPTCPPDIIGAGIRVNVLGKYQIEALGGF